MAASKTPPWGARLSVDCFSQPFLRCSLSRLSLVFCTHVTAKSLPLRAVRSTAIRGVEMAQSETVARKDTGTTGATQPALQRPRWRRWVAPLIVAAVFVGLLVSGVRSRIKDNAKLRVVTAQ